MLTGVPFSAVAVEDLPPQNSGKSSTRKTKLLPMRIWFALGSRRGHSESPGTSSTFGNLGKYGLTAKGPGSFFIGHQLFFCLFFWTFFLDCLQSLVVVLRFWCSVFVRILSTRVLALFCPSFMARTPISSFEF